jgi:hypothetical protein
MAAKGNIVEHDEGKKSMKIEWVNSWLYSCFVCEKMPDRTANWKYISARELKKP